MKTKERRVTEKTKVKISITILAGFIIFIIVTTFGASAWTSDIEHRIKTNTKQITITQEVQKEVLKQLIEQDGLFIEILTDLKWIRADLEERD